MQTIIANLVADLKRERAKNRHLRHLLDTIRNHDHAVDSHDHDDIVDSTIYPPLQLVSMQLPLDYRYIY